MAAADVPDANATTGIVWAYRFERDGSAQLIPADLVDQAIAEHSASWIWIHLGLADNRCRAWIANHAPASSLAREVLAGPDQHLRLDVIGSEIVGVIPDLHQEWDAASDHLVRLRFVMTERLLITSRQRPVHSIDINRRAIEAGKLFPTAVSFLDALIDEFADQVSHLADRLSAKLDTVEEHFLDEDPSDERVTVGQIRLQAARMHRQLAQLRGIFQRLEPRLAIDNAPVAQAMRALTQKLFAIDHEVASLQERARLLLDETTARMTAVTNRRLYTLSILTACLLPPTLVTGFFGMNTKDLPFQDPSGGTWLAGLFAIAAAGLTYWALRKLRAF